MSKRALFIGRFQPFHLGHEWLIRNKLDKGVPCLVAVRDIEPDLNNPLHAKISAELIKKAFEGEDVEVIIIPDIESVNWGRGVGYETNEFAPPPDIYNISATQIRKEINEGIEDWKTKVNPKIHHALKIYLEANIKTYRFYKENGTTWYADIPEWTGSKEELMMVAGADTMLDVLSNRGIEIDLDISKKNFPGAMSLELLRVGQNEGGGYYRMMRNGHEIMPELWLCDVTKFVFNGPMPEVIYIRQHQEI